MQISDDARAIVAASLAAAFYSASGPIEQDPKTGEMDDPYNAVITTFESYLQDLLGGVIQWISPASE